jgi:phosphohistidine phosphatase
VDRPSVLQLVRHAKSSWSDPTTADLDRPLSARGMRAAHALAQHLASFDRRPDIVVCSPATRTRQTLAAIEAVLGTGAEIRIDPALYDGGPSELLGALRALPAAAFTVMVIGHNPTMQDLALRLIAPKESDELARLRVKFPTAAMATLATPHGWDRLTTGCADLEGFWTAR